MNTQAVTRVCFKTCTVLWLPYHYPLLRDICHKGQVNRRSNLRAVFLFTTASFWKPLLSQGSEFLSLINKAFCGIMFIVTPFASGGSLSCYPSSKNFHIYLATSSCFFSTNFLWIWKIAFIGWNSPSGSFAPPHEFNYSFCVCMCLRVEICLKINCDSWTADVKVLGLVYNASPMFLSCVWRSYEKKWKVSGLYETGWRFGSFCEEVFHM